MRAECVDEFSDEQSDELLAVHRPAAPAGGRAMKPTTAADLLRKRMVEHMAEVMVLPTAELHEWMQ